ncbi:MAG: alkaline phosphatase family protein [Gemmatimonadota bacterium]|jgi:predicted AlkP superfamily phosphohydrolase/phosphomutase|nr:MAG: alkaline phosphatase family protein [Gemmatimonadota bacterium]
MMTHRPAHRVGCRALALALALVVAGCGEEVPTVGKRVVVLGFDGMDYALASRLLEEGRLPNLARLAEAGGFSPLQTSIPPQSPVAWSDFITGRDAGGHGIFDFIHRDPATMLPYLSTSRTEAAGRVIRIGAWQVPLSGGTVELLRRGVPFWEELEKAGVPTWIMRIPANFPPSGSASRELSGMGTPDILGTYGTFSYYTTSGGGGRDLSGGDVYPVRIEDGVVRASLVGPANPFRVDGEPTSAEFAVYVDPERPVAKLVLGDRELMLAEGEWSSWLPVDFRLLPLHGIGGEVRFYLKQVRPDFALYVTPVNIDPLDPAMPISTPEAFAAELARATGRYYTQGMPEDTKALTSDILDEAEFLEQTELAAEEFRRTYRHLLDRFEDGLLFYYFGFVDQVSHVMWHAMDPEHPVHDPIRDAPFADAVERQYVKADSIVGETLDRLGDDATLIVMSDHGFTSWRRSFNLNTWLKDNGYLALVDPERQGEAEYFGNVDWSRTQAYGLGFSGLYLNLRGRDRLGIVPENQRRMLLEEIRRGLLRVTDPATGEPAITKVYLRDEIFEDGGSREAGPDLIVGYARGIRASDDTSLGKVPRELFVDNREKWSGDHIMDHEVVPGVLFSNRPLERPARSLRELRAALLAEFGLGEAFMGAE